MRQVTMTGARLFAVALLLFAAAPAVHAQQAERPAPLALTYQNLTLSKDSVRVKSGRSAVMPHDTLRYTLTFTNHENRALNDIVFTNPIPSGLFLVPGTVSTSTGAKVEYSIDGGVEFSEQPMVVVRENDREYRRPATPESYTHIRWTLLGAIAPQAQVVARYDARVARQ
jgi:uncharacterized repeat protein (TIGR01451 family)